MLMHPSNTSDYAADSVGSVMSMAVPTCTPNENLHDIVHRVTAKKWDSITDIYVIDNDNKLLGYIDLGAVVQSDHQTKIKDVMTKVKVALRPTDQRTKLLFVAVNNDVVTVPITDEHNHLMGAVTADRIIDIMHNEHIEEALITGGVHKGQAGNILKLTAEHTFLIVKHRLPWLVVGLVVGLGLGVISSFFDAQLTNQVALAYFIPLVAYIAGSVGTQTEAITIRTLATLEIGTWSYIWKELLVGCVLGVTMGILGGAGAVLISHSIGVGFVVGLSLFAASVIAAVLGSIIPMIFKAQGKDPALGSGPLATALQDAISILIYFLFAVTLL